jgi:dihydropteroate synthase
MCPRALYSVPLPNDAKLHLGDRTFVMGVLNITPDSFADAPHLTDPARAIDAALRMEADGADLIDIGGESSRPGSKPVPAGEEMSRILPVLDGLRGRLQVPISVDTTKADVAAAAVRAGAAIINDVSGLRGDPALAGVAAESGAALILTHARGRSATMYSEAVYEDVVAEVAAELRDSVRRAAEAGVPRDRIIVDPGIGFAKRPAHSYGVLAGLATLASGLELPILVGPSRKSFMLGAIGNRPAAERDWGTAAAVTAAVLFGAHIVRVHAVAEMMQVVRVAEEIRRHPAFARDRPTRELRRSRQP